MEARELIVSNLKCGNILNYDTAEGEILPTVIDWQDLKWLTEDTKGFNLVHSPIPLTEEWLLRFGFEPYSKHATYIELSIESREPHKHVVIRFNRSMNYFSVFNHSECDFTEMQFIRRIESVHQLQNIYWCLCGKELTLNEL